MDSDLDDSTTSALRLWVLLDRGCFNSMVLDTIAVDAARVEPSRSGRSSPKIYGESWSDGESGPRPNPATPTGSPMSMYAHTKVKSSTGSLVGRITCVQTARRSDQPARWSSAPPCAPVRREYTASSLWKPSLIPNVSNRS